MISDFEEEYRYCVNKSDLDKAKIKVTLNKCSYIYGFIDKSVHNIKYSVVCFCKDDMCNTFNDLKKSAQSAYGNLWKAPTINKMELHCDFCGDNIADTNYANHTCSTSWIRDNIQDPQCREMLQLFDDFWEVIT